MRSILVAVFSATLISLAGAYQLAGNDCWRRSPSSCSHNQPGWNQIGAAVAAGEGVNLSPGNCLGCKGAVYDPFGFHFRGNGTLGTTTNPLYWGFNFSFGTEQERRSSQSAFTVFAVRTEKWDREALDTINDRYGAPMVPNSFIMFSVINNRGAISFAAYKGNSTMVALTAFPSFRLPEWSQFRVYSVYWGITKTWVIQAQIRDVLFAFSSLDIIFYPPGNPEEGLLDYTWGAAGKNFNRGKVEVRAPVSVSSFRGVAEPQCTLCADGKRCVKLVSNLWGDPCSSGRTHCGVDETLECAAQQWKAVGEAAVGVDGITRLTKGYQSTFGAAYWTQPVVIPSDKLDSVKNRISIVVDFEFHAFSTAARPVPYDGISLFLVDPTLWNGAGLGTKASGSGYLGKFFPGFLGILWNNTGQRSVVTAAGCKPNGTQQSALWANSWPADPLWGANGQYYRSNSTWFSVHVELEFSGEKLILITLWQGNSTANMKPMIARQPFVQQFPACRTPKSVLVGFTGAVGMGFDQHWIRNQRLTVKNVPADIPCKPCSGGACETFNSSCRVDRCWTAVNKAACDGITAVTTCGCLWLNSTVADHSTTVAGSCVPYDFNMTEIIPGEFAPTASASALPESPGENVPSTPVSTPVTVSSEEIPGDSAPVTEPSAASQ